MTANKHSLRIESGKYLVELGKKNESIVVLDADLKDSTQSINFQNAFPQRFFDIGVAEQNMVGIAAGMALAGKIPFVQTFACFASMRACEQVRTAVAYPKLNVKFLVTHSGVSTGTAGTTHHSIEDLAIMRAIPNMTVFAPCDVHETKYVLDEALKIKGPVYIRLDGGDAECFYDDENKFNVGELTQIRKGQNVAIITTGTMLNYAVEAYNQLEIDKKPSVYQLATIKPIKNDSILAKIKKYHKIITIEDHNIIGGLGSVLSELIAENGLSIKLIRLGIQDRFCDIGSALLLRKNNGISCEKIMELFA